MAKQTGTAPPIAPATSAIGERDAVMKATQSYINGVRLGSSTVMRSGFHEAAMIFGYYPGGVMNHPIQALFDWIDKNGPSPDLKAEFGDIQVRESIASIQLELRTYPALSQGETCKCPTSSFCFGLMKAGRSLRKLSIGINRQSIARAHYTALGSASSLICLALVPAAEAYDSTSNSRSLARP
jgi:hypothetical protein